MTQGSEDRRGSGDRRHWRGGWLGLYVNGRDSRLWVPKRQPALGWTLNLAHPRARWIAALVLALVAAGILVARFLDS